MHSTRRDQSARPARSITLWEGLVYFITPNFAVDARARALSFEHTSNTLGLLPTIIRQDDNIGSADEIGCRPLLRVRVAAHGLDDFD
jgi:hypothetical protein